MKTNFFEHGMGVVIASAVAIIGMGWAEGFSSAPMHRVLLGCLLINIMEFLFSIMYHKYYFTWGAIPIGVLVTGSWGWVVWEMTTTDISLIGKIPWVIFFLFSGYCLIISHDRDWEGGGEMGEDCCSSGGSWGSGGFDSSYWSGNYGGRD
jgi:hypothetical protein